MFTKALKKCFRNYFVLKGRASRKEYWYFFILVAVVYIFGLVMSLDYLLTSGTIANWLSILFGIVDFILLIPYITVSCRRFHDIGKSAGWIFINFIPLVGTIFYYVWMAFPPDKKNKYGSVAKLK